jgi:organic hydroperoxide reductase OsmC/OhrA
MDSLHRYNLQLDWCGDHTRTYDSYSREHLILIDGKPELTVTADRMFLGDMYVHNPEDLLLASLSSCHLLTYLALCARARINVLHYVDFARGSLRLTPEGGGQFVEVLLRPRVTVESESMRVKAHRFHEEVHRYCFIQRSVNFPVLCEPTVMVG